MAIEKTTFTQYTVAELKAYLETNASSYFNSFELDNSKLLCKIGEQTVLAISLTPEAAPYGTSLEITPVGESTAATRAFKGSGRSQPQGIYAGYKSSKGVLLASQSSYSILICKNSDGDTCLVTVTYQYPSSSTSDKPVEIWDLSNSTTPYEMFKMGSQQPTNAYSFGKLHNSCLSMFPLTTAAGKLLTGVNMSYLSPYVGEFLYAGLLVQVGSTKYAYTGVLALQE